MNLKIKNTIAKLCCILTVVLMSTNVGLSASNFSDSFSSPKKESHTPEFYKSGQNHAGQNLNLIKDPSDEGFSIDYIPAPVIRIVYAVFPSEEEKFEAYAVKKPFYKSVPIWILTRQILI